MHSSIYIERQLVLNDEIIPEKDLFHHSDCIVLLAEPGAGKTRLLSSLAEKLKPVNRTITFHYIIAINFLV